MLPHTWSYFISDKQVKFLIKDVAVSWAGRRQAGLAGGKGQIAFHSCFSILDAPVSHPLVFISSFPSALGAGFQDPQNNHQPFWAIETSSPELHMGTSNYSQSKNAYNLNL